MLSIVGTRELLEYTVKQEAVKFIEKENVTWVAVCVVFQRRMEYHVSNTFLQSFVMVITGGLTFYFRIDNFTDRIMVSLTVMLVVANLISAIQTVS